MKNKVKIETLISEIHRALNILSINFIHQQEIKKIRINYHSEFMLSLYLISMTDKFLDIYNLNL